jgi:hypothetical protein
MLLSNKLIFYKVDKLSILIHNSVSVVELSFAAGIALLAAESQGDSCPIGAYQYPS